MRTLFLTLITCLFVLPAHAKYGGGTGEPNDPYQIATAADLIALGETPEDYSKHFILTADIDLDPNLPGRKVFDKAVIGATWGPPFTGAFDGNGHTISNLTINGQGLFGQLESVAEVRDLGLINVNIFGPGDHIGGLVGWNYGHVAATYSTGVVRWQSEVGGLVGYNAGVVTHCYSAVAVSGNYNVGGLVGSNGGAVTHCYSTGAVRACEGITFRPMAL